MISTQTQRSPSLQASRRDCLRAAIWSAAALVMLLTPGAALANGRADIIKYLDPALRKHIQLALKKAGFYRGRVDGNIGPASESAIRRFRIARGIAGERETFGPDYPGMGTDLTYYLTPKLITALFGIEFREGTAELTREEQYNLMKRLGVRPTPGLWEDFTSPEA